LIFSFKEFKILESAFQDDVLTSRERRMKSERLGVERREEAERAGESELC